MSKLTGFSKRITAMLLSGMLIMGSASASVYASERNVDLGQTLEKLIKDVSHEEEGELSMGITVKEDDVEDYTVILDANSGSFTNEKENVFERDVQPSDFEPFLIIEPQINCFLQEHVDFINSSEYQERMNSCWSSYIYDGLNGFGSRAAEGIYYILDTPSDLLNFKKASLFDNPYDAILVLMIRTEGGIEGEQLKMNFSSSFLEMAKAFEDTCSSLNPEWSCTHEDFCTHFANLLMDQDTYKKNNPVFYQQTKKIFSLFCEEEDAFAQFMSKYGKVSFAYNIISDTMNSFDAFLESMNYAATVKACVKVSDDYKTFLKEVSNSMSTNAILSRNPMKFYPSINQYAIYSNNFSEACEKYEKYMSEDKMALIIWDYVKDNRYLPLKMALPYLDDYITHETITYCKEGLMLSETAAQWVFAAIEAYKTGWKLSEILTKNQKNMECREMARAYYYLEHTMSGIVKDRANTLKTGLQDNHARQFDMAYRNLQTIESATLANYKSYLEAQDKSILNRLIRIIPFINIGNNSGEEALCEKLSDEWAQAVCHRTNVFIPKTEDLDPLGKKTSPVDNRDTKTKTVENVDEEVLKMLPLVNAQVSFFRLSSKEDYYVTSCKNEDVFWNTFGSYCNSNLIPGNDTGEVSLQDGGVIITRSEVIDMGYALFDDFEGVIPDTEFDEYGPISYAEDEDAYHFLPASMHDYIYREKGEPQYNDDGTITITYLYEESHWPNREGPETFAYDITFRLNDHVNKASDNPYYYTIISVEKLSESKKNESVADSDDKSQIDDEYILPDSDKRLLTEDDINEFDEEILMLARNEIYARHGRLFKDENIQSYFNTKSWYKGEIPPEEFQQETLSEIEQTNAEFILKYEKDKKNDEVYDHVISHLQGLWYSCTMDTNGPWHKMLCEGNDFDGEIYEIIEYHEGYLVRIDGGYSYYFGKDLNSCVFVDGWEITENNTYGTSGWWKPNEEQRKEYGD